MLYSPLVRTSYPWGNMQHPTSAFSDYLPATSTVTPYRTWVIILPLRTLKFLNTKTRPWNTYCLLLFKLDLADCSLPFLIPFFFENKTSSLSFMGSISSKQSRTRKRQKVDFIQPSVNITSDHLMRKTYPLFAVRQIANAYAARAHSTCPAECNPAMPLLYALGERYFPRQAKGALNTFLNLFSFVYSFCVCRSPFLGVGSRVLSLPDAPTRSRSRRPKGRYDFTLGLLWKLPSGNYGADHTGESSAGQGHERKRSIPPACGMFVPRLFGNNSLSFGGESISGECDHPRGLERPTPASRLQWICRGNVACNKGKPCSIDCFWSIVPKTSHGNNKRSQKYARVLVGSRDAARGTAQTKPFSRGFGWMEWPEKGHWRISHQWILAENISVGCRWKPFRRCVSRDASYRPRLSSGGSYGLCIQFTLSAVYSRVCHFVVFWRINGTPPWEASATRSGTGGEFSCPTGPAFLCPWSSKSSLWGRKTTTNIFAG